MGERGPVCRRGPRSRLPPAHGQGDPGCRPVRAGGTAGSPPYAAGHRRRATRPRSRRGVARRAPDAAQRDPSGAGVARPAAVPGRHRRQPSGGARPGRAGRRGAGGRRASRGQCAATGPAASRSDDGRSPVRAIQGHGAGTGTPAHGPEAVGEKRRLHDDPSRHRSGADGETHPVDRFGARRRATERGGTSSVLLGPLRISRAGARHPPVPL